MRTAQKIVDQSYYNAKDHKDKGLSIKRARTTLAKLNLDELDMSVKEKATITTAIATLGVVAQMPVAAEVGSGDERDELGSG